MTRSALRRTWGLARSVAVYHAIPLRQRRLRAFYSQFVSPGDLVFDIGAHAGNHTRAFAALGCRVVAIDPQPDFARLLHALFAKTPSITVIEAAASDANGHAQLAISDRTPTVSTIAADWRTARAVEDGFAHVQWNRVCKVQTITLDALITRYGVPRFIKLDVEGAEAQVLGGLSESIAALSFEYFLEDIELVEQCLGRVERWGTYRFNWSIGESRRLMSPQWMTADQLITILRSETATKRSGDIYAVRVQQPPQRTT